MFGDGGLDTQLCPTFCDPIRLLCPWDFSQARILEWVAIFFSRGSSWLANQILISYIAGRFLLLSHQGSPTSIFKYAPKFVFPGTYIQKEYMVNSILLAKNNQVKLETTTPQVPKWPIPPQPLNFLLSIAGQG